MKVSELIENLKQFNPELEVVVDGYETGYDILKEISQIVVIPASKNKGWYDGEYRDIEENPLVWVHDIKEVVYLPRSS